MTLGDGPLGRPQTLVDPKSFGAPAEVNEATGIPKQLGLRLKLQKGDALLWPNVHWRGDDPIEDVRTVRVHLPLGPSDEHRTIGIDAFFHDQDLREQRKLRMFCEESG
ncbi:Hypothetical protein SCF082_LOCUS47009 [Durusdinium trenchii]|uniref:Uncharacterized protein n=1 Tax=Durusdinium trenchii TaxID=1381693 RepID=A0ABP0RIM8_9DINO